MATKKTNTVTKTTKKVETSPTKQKESVSIAPYVAHWKRVMHDCGGSDTKALEEITLDVLDLAAIRIKELFKINFACESIGESGADPRLIGCIFSVTFTSILDKLVELEAKHPSYYIDVLGRFRIGYKNFINDESEKTGNIFPIIEDLSRTNDMFIESDSSLSQKENITNWNIAYRNNPNTTKDYQLLKKIAIHAVNRLKKDFKLTIGDEEVILPIFVTTYDSLVYYLRRNGDKYNLKHIPFYEYFSIMYIKKKDKFEFKPTMAFKYALKSDIVATSPFD